MIPITPILVGFPTQEATHFNLIPIIESTTATSCITRWQLFKETKRTIKVPQKNEENITVMIDKVVSDYKLVVEGNEPVSAEEYALWGADNSYIEDIVLVALGLNRQV